MSAVVALFRRELSLAWAGGGGPLLVCGFMLCLGALVPLTAGPDARALAPVAGAIGWIALALASLLSLERLFERDFEDGSLDLLALGPQPLEVVVLTKVAAPTIALGLPLAVAAPVVALSLGLPGALAGVAALAALIGALAFALTGALGAALALGSRRGGLLIAVVVLPLFIPPAVFGSGALTRAAIGVSPGPALGLLAAYALFALVITPFAAAAAIRNAQG